MCGIFGAVNTKKCFQPDQFARFRQVTDLVRYRGPDDAGYMAFHGTSPVNEGCPFDIFLGHRRLSIIDLSPSGHQPMTDGSGLWLTYNGEIFNYVELRAELIACGHTFTTATDSEVILRLYEEFGEAAFGRMNGMWALALVDLCKRRVVLSRDRFSIKPLYVAEAGDEIYFGSEIKQVSPLLPSNQPNLRVMSAFLDQGLLDHSVETFYMGVSRVPPATNVVIDLVTGNRTSHRYWNWPEPQPVEGDITEQFRELFLDSIRIRLRSDVKVGTLLSGGIDSTSIAVLAHALSGNATTHSMISDSDCSEEPYVDIVTAALRNQNNKINAPQTCTVESIERVLFHHDEPFGGLNVVAQFGLMEFIRSQTDTTVLLSGQGADEVLLGYLKYFIFHLRELASKKQYSRICGEVLGSLLHRTVWHQVGLGKSRCYRRSSAPRKFLRTTGERESLWDSAEVRTRQISDIEKYSVPALTHYEDRSAMAFGLEIRHPFLDHRLVEFAINIPVNAKIHHGWSKHVLRNAVPELPPEIRWRRDKQGFVMPEEEWLRQGLGLMLVELSYDSVLAEMGVLNPKEFRDFYQRFESSATDIWHNEITRVLTAELWARQFREVPSGTNRYVTTVAA